MMTQKVAARRPLSVIVVSILIGLNGIGSILAALAVSSSGPADGSLVALNLLFGAGVLFVAWGLFALKPWAWTITVILQVMGLVSAIAAWIQDPASWLVVSIDVVLSVLILGLLVRPRVRTAFGPLLGPPPASNG